MVQANELKIENWVELRGEYLQVFSIENKSTATHSKVELQLDSETLDKHIKGVNIRDVKPIHLSEEILLKCGFEILDDGKVKHDSLSDFETNFIFNSKSDIIKYLHQLQNLYFSLIGEELEVKL